jgi:hypothetical protein
VFDFRAGAAMSGDVMKGPAEELEAHQRGFAAVPRKGDIRTRLRLEELANVGFEQAVRHAEAIPGIEQLPRQKKTIRAVQIARRSCGLENRVKVTPRG